MSITLYCADCGKPSSLLYHLEDGELYWYRSCICPTDEIAPPCFQRKVTKKDFAKALGEQIKALAWKNGGGWE